MKKKHIVLTVGLIALGTALVLTSGLDAQSAGSKNADCPIAVCDLAEVFSHSQRSQDLSAQFEKEAEKVAAEGRKRREKIQAIQQELKGLNPSSQEFENRSREIQRLQINLKAWIEYKSSIQAREQIQQTKDMFNEASKVIADIAKQQGYKVVLFRAQGSLKNTNFQKLVEEIRSRQVLFSDPSVDITTDVLTALNEAYRAKK